MTAPRSIDSYAYPCDNDIARLLDSPFVQSDLRKIANLYYSKQIHEAINTGVVVIRVDAYGSCGWIFGLHSAFDDVSPILDRYAYKLISGEIWAGIYSFLLQK